MTFPKARISLSLVVTAATLVSGANLRASLLSVDLGNSGTTPAGFSLWDPSAPNNNVGYPLDSADFGGIHLALNASNVSDIGTAPAVDASGNLAAWSNGIITRSRAPIGTTSYGNMYQDFVTAAAGGAVGLQISGLAANSTYSLRFWSFDENGSRTSIFTDYTNGSASPIGSITYSNPSGAGSGAPTSDSQYSLDALLTTDALGRLTVAETQQGGIAPVLNGFEIDSIVTPVPEANPAAIAFALLATAAALHRVRRQAGTAIAV